MSAGFKDLVKGGWHSGQNKSQNFSVRRDVKGANTVAKRLGHGREEYTDMSNHSAAPLSTLKDPASFGPPPKHIATHGPEAAAASSSNGGETGSAAPPPSRAQTLPANTSSPRPPAVPSRQGLGEKSWASPPASTTSAPAGAPRLPPRLPTRPSTRAEDITSPPPPYEETPSEQVNEQTGYVNQAAVGRLGKSGVSVPGFGIGSGSQSPASTGRHSATPPSQNQMNELGPRFAKMGRSGSTDTASPAPSTGTSWAQKQNALKTADSFRRDPNSVSLKDAKSAASTANNFRQRHGEQVAAGVNKANALNQQYGNAGPGAKMVEEEEEEEEQRRREQAGSGDVAVAAAAKKKPPLPPKKNALSATGGGGGTQTPSDGGSPPPIPLSSKPR